MSSPTTEIADLFPAPPPQAAEQLPLALDVDNSMRAEDFLMSPANRVARTLVDRWPEGGDPVLLLTGPPGAGKTHLARIWQARTGAVWLRPPIDASRAEAALLGHGPWVVDEAERVGDEAFLFHLINVARARGAGLVLISSFPASAWRPHLPDLRSRLLAAPTVAIEAPDDTLLAAVLVKQFADRQLRVPFAVVEFLALRMERSFAACRRVVELVDRVALAQGRPLNTGLARDVLAWLDGERD